MELPDDILGLVREFSRPLLPFVTEYKTAIRKLARGSDMDRLYLDIKKKLYTDQAELIAETFLAYANSVVATNRSYSLMPKLGDPSWLDYSSSMRDKRNSFWICGYWSMVNVRFIPTWNTGPCIPSMNTDRVSFLYNS